MSRLDFPKGTLGIKSRYRIATKIAIAIFPSIMCFIYARDWAMGMTLRGSDR